MSLTEGAVALLARQAVDLLDPAVEIDLVPGSGADPYRFDAMTWTVWPLLDDRRSFGIRLQAQLSPVEALASLLDDLSENLGQTDRFWGVAFQACPGHLHPAYVSQDRDEVVLSCPSTRAVVQRIRPFEG